MLLLRQLTHSGWGFSIDFMLLLRHLYPYNFLKAYDCFIVVEKE